MVSTDTYGRHTTFAKVSGKYSFCVLHFMGCSSWNLTSSRIKSYKNESISSHTSLHISRTFIIHWNLLRFQTECRSVHKYVQRLFILCHSYVNSARIVAKYYCETPNKFLAFDFPVTISSFVASLLDWQMNAVKKFTETGLLNDFTKVPCVFKCESLKLNFFVRALQASNKCRTKWMQFMLFLRRNCRTHEYTGFRS